MHLLIWLLGLFYIGACAWLVLVVLMQEGKSGGMAGMESSSAAPGAFTDTFGAGANKTLFKVTAWTAALFFGLAIALTLFGASFERGGGQLDLGEATIPSVSTEVAPGIELPVAADEPAAEPAATEPAAPATTQ